MSRRPERIQLSRRKGWRLPPNARSVARPSKWGNLYRIDRQGRGPDAYWEVWSWASMMGGPTDRVTWGYQFATKLEAAAKAVELFARDFGPGGDDEFEPDELAELRGYDLGCWCPLTEGQRWYPCHASLLLTWANR